MIGEDRQYPARSAVCSIDFEPGSTPNVKFEFCAHCAYSSEAEAAGRCLAWMGREGLDADLYRDTIHLLAPGRPLNEVTPPQVHAYLGVGLRHGTAYSTFYLNPGPGLAAQAVLEDRGKVVLRFILRGGALRENQCP